LRDKDGNVVKGKRIVFRVEDITGGSVSPSSAITDIAGQASITYYAGGSPSATNGVTVYARVEGVNSIYCNDGRVNASECAVNLTVALKKVFITIGTGNKMEAYNQTAYAYPYSVLITDINGAPVENEQVILSINTTHYFKGSYGFDAGAKVWKVAPTISCESEDKNTNGLLDPGEDTNGDTLLTPGNVATFSAESASAIENNSIAIKTGKDGFGSFKVVYPKNYGRWAQVKLTVRAGESSAYETFRLQVLAEDVGDEKNAPPGQFSPFGVGGPAVVNDKGEVSYPNASCNNAF